MQEIADSDAIKLESDLSKAIKNHPKKIIVLTHVPPFREACLYQGEVSGDDWLPFFSSKVMGDLLFKYAGNNPSINFLVLCGHTHSKTCYQPLNNLIVKVGGADYHHPEVQELIYI